MDITLRCDEVKVISEGEKVKLIITGIDEQDLTEAYGELDRLKYVEMFDETVIHDGEY